MKQTYLAEILPKQEKGMKTDTESAVTWKNLNEAKEHFRKVKERLHDINRWHQYAGKGTAAFQLYDNQGNLVQRPVRKGDYFQIDIPGPGSKSGEGKDWVEVQQMGDRDSEHEELSFITVRSASHPLSLETKPAHFFANTATSSFVVYREGLRVMAAVYGRMSRPIPTPTIFSTGSATASLPSALFRDVQITMEGVYGWDCEERPLPVS